MKSKLLFVFLFFLIFSSYIISADSVQTGRATLVVTGSNAYTNNSNYSSNMTGDVVAEAENHASLLSIIIDFFKGIFS